MSGVVVDQTGLPLPGVQIEVHHGDAVESTTISGSDGTFAFTKPTDPESLRAWREVLRQLLVERRPGYLHFEKAHTVVLERNFDCVQCHRESSPLALTADQVDRHALIEACVICHGSVKE